MLRSVLVALDGSRGSEAATTLALDWGRRLGARLVALGILDAPSIHGGEAVPLGAGAYKRARDDARMMDAHARVLEFLAEFRARCTAAGVAADVLEDVGDPVETILSEAPRCDIVVVGRETRFRFDTEDRPDPTLRVAGPRWPLARTVAEPYNRQFGGIHPGICQFVFLDGSIRTISNVTSGTILGFLANRDDGRAVPEF